MKRLKSTDVMDRLGIHSKETLRKLWKVRKVIPAPVKDEGGCCNYWLESDINQYIAAQAEKRTQERPEALAA